MKLTSKMPKKGQFVAIWQYEGNTWCNTMRIKDGAPQKHVDNRGEEYWQSDTSFPNEYQTDVLYMKLT
jgi:hypothetical protein